MMFKSAAFLLLTATLSYADYCGETFPLRELPDNIRNDLLVLFTKGNLDTFAGCQDDVTIVPDHIRFWLWTNDAPNVPTILDHKKPEGVHEKQPTIFLLHGWLCNVTSNKIPEMKDAYLQRYKEANIIGVEWTYYAVDVYANSYCRVPKIATVLAEFICNLHNNYNIDLNSIHIVGHSLGGQISGLTGQEVQRLCNQKVRRITALDPAGPLFQKVPESQRLDASDATIVDVIHTNQLQAGFYDSCGTVDFYPNCGYFQPGCEKITADYNTTVLLEQPIAFIGCSHVRSLDYFLEGIINNKFIAHSCRNCPGVEKVGLCMPDVVRRFSSLMGEEFGDIPRESTKFYLRTNHKAPFATGV